MTGLPIIIVSGSRKVGKHSLVQALTGTKSVEEPQRLKLATKYYIADTSIVIENLSPADQVLSDSAQAIILVINAT